MTGTVQFEASEKLKLRSVCVTCGEMKKQVFAKCPSCDYRPQRDYEIARALILSETFTINDDVQLGRDFDQLETISEAIKRGRPYPYEHDEQQQVLYEYRRYLRNNSGKMPWWKRRKKVVVISLVCAITAGVVLSWLLM